MENVELRVFNTELEPLGIIDEIKSLIWTTTYWNEGTNTDMKLLVPFTANNAKLLKNGSVVIKQDTADLTNSTGNWRRAAEITYRKITKDVNGAEQIEVQGCFLKKWLSKRVILNKIKMTGTEQEKINRIVVENHGVKAEKKRQIQKFCILPQEALGGTQTDYLNEDYIDAGLEVYNRALAGKLGYDILANEKEKQYGFYLYKGKDLTGDNKEGNEPAIFSREFDNVNEQEYTESGENIKNVIYVVGQENNAGIIPTVVVSKNEEGLKRNEVYKDLNISRAYKENEVEIEIPENAYISLLYAAGDSELENYREAISFKSELNLASNLKYIKDFNIGDRITCVERRWGIKINARITEVIETYQGGKKEIEITLGESLPTLIQQIRKVR